MRNAIPVVLVFLALSQPSLAEDGIALSAGRPAGVKNAQMSDYVVVGTLVGIAAIIAGCAIIFDRSNHNSASGTTP
jgi:hypothetical protein